MRTNVIQKLNKRIILELPLVMELLFFEHSINVEQYENNHLLCFIELLVN